MLAGVEHRLGFGDSCNDVVPFIAVGLGDSFYAQVVALCSPRRESDLLRGSADQGRNLPARALDSLFSFPTELVTVTGSVPKFARQVREHGLKHAGIDWRGGGIVEIYRKPRRRRLGTAGHESIL